MKNIIIVVLILVIAFLTYALIEGIKEPIAFQKVKKERKEAVVAKLENIRKAQEFYRDITGEFANNFDSLEYVLKTDSFRIEKIIGDPDDPTGQEFQRIIIKKPAIDSINLIGLSIEDLSSVPFGDGAKFSIDADTLTYQSSLVHVTEVATRWKDFMGEYASKKYSKYDNSYDPNAAMKFGNMYAPSLAGSWK